MKKAIVIYHANCDDGVASAWVAWKYFAGKHGTPVSFVPASYGDAPPNVEGADVYILDFSYAPEVVCEMTAHARSLILLDHHKSAREKWKSFEENPDLKWSTKIEPHGRVCFDMERSGASMAWDYFFPDEEVPTLIHHIEDNDLWLFRDNNTKAFIRALRSYPQDIETFDMINNLVADPLDYSQFLDEGEAIERYFNQQCDFVLDTTPPMRVRVGDAVGLGVNAPKTFSSELGNLLAERSGTFGLTWYLDGDNAIVSLRSKGSYDVSKLAAKHGGGGHRNAAGFTKNINYFIHNVLGKVWYEQY